MILIICDPSDDSALQLGGRLNSQCNDTVEVVTCEEIIYSPRFTHFLSTTSTDCPVHITRLDANNALKLSGIINRIAVPPRDHLLALTENDRDYAFQELFSALASWLSAIQCPVLNRPTAVSLSGPTYSPVAWNQMAVDAGIVPEIKAFELDRPEPVAKPTAARVIVFNNRIYGMGRRHELENACLRLSEKIGAILLEIRFSQNDLGDMEFGTATTFVDFAIGGEDLVADILSYFDQSDRSRT